MSDTSPHIIPQHNTTPKAAGKPLEQNVPKNLNRGPFYPNPQADIDKPAGPRGCVKSSFALLTSVVKDEILTQELVAESS